MAALHFLLPGDPATVSGGFLYDAKIVAALRESGREVALHALPAGFPCPSAATRAAAERLLAQLPEGAALVVDGLALGALPEPAARHAGRLRLIALVHHPLAAETGLDTAARDRLFESERAALAQVSGVIATSPRTARDLAAYGLPAARIRVVEPGTDPSPLAAGSGGEAPMLLCVASLTPRKGHAVLLEALARLRGRPWRLICAGSATRDPACAESLSKLCAKLGLAERVDWLGEVSPDDLDRLYHGADLFVLASHHEGYGMVLAEALMRGLPIVATRAGAIPETLPAEAACLVPPGEPAALAGALAPLLEDPAARASLATAARRGRESLPSWTEAGARFAAALQALGALPA